MSRTAAQVAAAALFTVTIYTTPANAQSAAALATATLHVAAKQNQNSKDE